MLCLNVAACVLARLLLSTPLIRGPKRTTDGRPSHGVDMHSASEVKNG